jgi:hypothetical protein
VLKNNITTANGQNGIVIDADDVSLDLNGFTLTSGGGAASGVTVAPGFHQHVTIHDGVIRGFTEGIPAQQAHDSHIYRVDVTGHGSAGYGIRIGSSSVVEDCEIDGNGTSGGGVVLGSGSILRRCDVHNNLATGVDASSNALVEDNSILNNATVPGNAGIYVSGNFVEVTDNTLANFPYDIIVQDFKSAAIIDNRVSGCSSILIGASTVVFAPMNGIEHSNVARQVGVLGSGYC